MEDQGVNYKLIQVNNEISYFVLDVDGTMTDTGIFYDDLGNELKRFSTRDGEAIKIGHQAGLRFLVITGRKCNAVKRRMEELKIDFFEQGVTDKYRFLSEYISENDIKKEELGYIGDDINDLKAMSLAGFVACPADAYIEVKKKADYVSSQNGGYGAVRDVIECYLRSVGKWESAVAKVYR